MTFTSWNNGKKGYVESVVEKNIRKGKKGENENSKKKGKRRGRSMKAPEKEEEESSQPRESLHGLLGSATALPPSGLRGLAEGSILAVKHPPSVCLLRLQRLLTDPRPRAGYSTPAEGGCC